MTMSTAEAAEARALQADRAERDRKFADEVEEASRGGVADLEAAIARLDAEAATAIGEYARSRALADQNPHEYATAFEAVRRRADQLPLLTAAVRRRLATVKQEAGAQAAKAWSTSSATQKLIAGYVSARATELGPIATLLSSYESAVASGATAVSMLPLPAGAVAELLAFGSYVKQIQSRGMKIDASSWPASVRERCA